MKSNGLYTPRQAQMIEAYQRLSSVWKVADEIGVCGQSVHEALSKLGVIHKMNYFTKEDELFLQENYGKYRAERRLGELAAMMGRTKQFLCRQAKKLGLTDFANRPPMRDDEKKKLSATQKERLKRCGHPRGYLNHKHSKESKRKMSDAVRARWADPSSIINSDAYRQSLSDRMAKNRANGTVRSKSNRTEVTSTFGGVTYTFKSSWEYEVAKRLDGLQSNNVIIKWEYEPDRFVFDDIKRGIRSYCPDFKVKTSTKEFYIEVKGWKMEQGMKRLALFQERNPQIKLYLIDEREYKKILSEADYLRRRSEQI